MHFGSELHAFSLHAGVLFGQLMNWLHSFDSLIASGPHAHAADSLIARTQDSLIARAQDSLIAK